MIERILPAETVSEENFGPLPADVAHLLLPEEAAHVVRAVPKRKGEFATVRVCARKALGQLGLAPVPLLPNRRGAPGWPAGVVGSMTHCEGYRAAVVARAADAVSIGIDAEPDAPLPDGVLDAISLPAERTQLAELAARRPEVAWDRMLFSAKESVFKTWYPLTAQELDFSEAELSFDAAGGAFSARLLVPGPVVGGCRLEGFTGRWLAAEGLVVTAIALMAGSRSPEGGLRESSVGCG